MRKIVFLLIIIQLISCQKKQDYSYNYPEILANPVTDTIFGTPIHDPYRNIENLKDTLVLNWLKSQEYYSDSIINQINNKQALFNQMMSFENRKIESVESYHNMKDGSYFYIKKDENDGIRKLYHKKTQSSKEKLIFNPENYKKTYSINYFRVSWDMTKVAISLSQGGTDKSELIIYDIENDTSLPPIIKNASPALVGGIRWLPDNSGLIYMRIPHFNYHETDYLFDTQPVLYHIKNNTYFNIFSQSANNHIPLKPEDFFITRIPSEDADYIFGSVSGVSTFNNVYFKNIEDLTSHTMPWKPLFSENEKIEQYSVANEKIIYKTSKDGQSIICETSLENPNFETSQVLIEAEKEEIILDFVLNNNELYYTTLKNGVDSRFYKISNGIKKEIIMPSPSGSSYVTKIGGNIVFSTSGWTKPNSYYKYFSEDSIVDITFNTTRYPEFENFVVEVVEVPSHDGELVPLSIIYNKDTVKNGKNKTIINGYGAYGASMSPFFYLPYLTWVSNGGILAISHVRGGGEKGDTWHKSGFKTTKSNSWKDFIACTNYLIDNKYTSKENTIAYGISAGGITVGRAITDAPELYAVACLDYPALHMLRSEFQPNGANSAKEFGTLKDSLEFKGLLDMDAYHHINNTNYPAIYVTTAMNDGQVTPWDPAKFVARIQKASTSGKPILFSINFEAGHGGGDGSMEQYYKDTSKMFAFSLWQTGHPDYQLKEN